MRARPKINSKPSVRSRRAPRRAAPDAITLLTRDHAQVRKLLREFTETRGAKTRSQLLERIALELRVHTLIEEEIFYPAFHAAARVQDDAQLFFEAAEEHGLVKLVLPDLERADPAGQPYGAKAKVLKDLVEHHAGEEEDELFPRARKLLGRERLAELGARMQARKDALLDDPAAVDRAEAVQERRAPVRTAAQAPMLHAGAAQHGAFGRVR